MIDILSKTPTTEIATLEEAKIFFRSENSGGIEDSLITGLIISAREWLEEAMNRSVQENTIRVYVYEYAGFLPFAPVASISSPVDLIFAGKSMPYIEIDQGVEIEYTTLANNTQIFKTATLELAFEWYRRGDQTIIPESVKRVVRAYKLKP